MDRPSICRYTLIKAGVVQPTAKEIAEDEQNGKSGAKNNRGYLTRTRGKL
jgi:hypothetical protein